MSLDETPNLTCLVTGPTTAGLNSASKLLHEDPEWSVVRSTRPSEAAVTRPYAQVTLRLDDPLGVDAAYGELVDHLESLRTPWFEPELDAILCTLDGFYTDSPLEIRNISKQLSWLRRLVPRLAGNARVVLIPAQGADAHLTDAFARLVEQQLQRQQVHKKHQAKVVFVKPDTAGDLLARCATDAEPPREALAGDAASASLNALAHAVEMALEAWVNGDTELRYSAK